MKLLQCLGVTSQYLLFGSHFGPLISKVGDQFGPLGLDHIWQGDETVYVYVNESQVIIQL